MDAAYSVSEESSIDGDMGPVMTKSGSSDSPIVISEKEVTSTGKQAKDMQIRKKIESKMFDKDAQDDENSLDQFFEEANKEDLEEKKDDHDVIVSYSFDKGIQKDKKEKKESNNAGAKSPKRTAQKSESKVDTTMNTSATELSQSRNDGDDTVLSDEEDASSVQSEMTDEASYDFTVASTPAIGQDPDKEELMIANESELVEIELGHQSMTRHLPADLVDAISRNTNLKRLTLNQKDCVRANFEILFEALEVNRYINQLEILNSSITKDTANALAACLSANDSVKKLSLRNCRFVKAALPILFVGLQHNKSIQHLVFEGTDLEGHVADVVSASIPLMNLVSVRFQKAHLSQEALSFLFKSLSKTPTIESINISDEIISVSSMKRLRDCVIDAERLKRIVLVNCGLDEICLETLCDGMMKNKMIEHLDVSKNKFGNEGADVLIDYLKENKDIKEIVAEDCRISRNEYAILMDSLRYNNTFLKNIFSPEVTLSILDSVKLMQNV